MTQDLEREVADHYGMENLTTKLLEALRASGVDPDRLTVQDLGAVDELHTGGRAATEYAVAKMALNRDDHMLDVGCGVGGATRYIASSIGCKVTGIDLTPEFIAAARELTRRTGLSDKISYSIASALDMPFAAATFDAAITLHVAMNIEDRSRLYREIARVLEPRARLCVFDIMKGSKDGLRYPVPWAETAATSHLTSPAEMRTLLEQAGFAIEHVEDRSDFAIAFFRQRLTQAAGAATAPAIGTHLIMANGRTKIENLLANIEQDRVAPMLMLARKR